MLKTCSQRSKTIIFLFIKSKHDVLYKNNVHTRHSGRCGYTTISVLWSLKLVRNRFSAKKITMKNQHFALLIYIFACIDISFPAGSGSGSGSGSEDDLEEEAICWSVPNQHEENITNSTTAVLQARCTSACISQVSMKI